MNKKDIAIRAAKTFAQAFLGVLVPEMCILLQGGFQDLPTFGKAIAPFVAAALAAGISAVWNGLASVFKTKDAEGEEDEE